MLVGSDWYQTYTHAQICISQMRKNEEMRRIVRQKYLMTELNIVLTSFNLIYIYIYMKKKLAAGMHACALCRPVHEKEHVQRMGTGTGYAHTTSYVYISVGHSNQQD